MTILALDSAGKRAGVALWRDDACIYDAQLATMNTHSETLLSMVRGALAAAETDMEHIDCIGVNAGPGSFTGLRIGLALAKGLALERDIPCAGVSTLEALVHTCILDGTVLCALDARRGEVYAAAFTVNGGVPTRLTEDDAMPAAAWQQFAQDAAKPLYLMGDGAAVAMAALGDILGVSVYPAPYTCGRAWGTAKAAADMMNDGKAGSAEALAPAYHRLSQAQRERAEREKNL